MSQSIGPEDFPIPIIEINSINEFSTRQLLHFLLRILRIQTVQSFTSCDEQSHLIRIIRYTISPHRQIILPWSVFHLKSETVAETGARETGTVVGTQLVTVTKLGAFVNVGTCPVKTVVEFVSTWTRTFTSVRGWVTSGLASEGWTQVLRWNL
ncbi:hypothetical protein GCK72_000100 [Caenorhabditis remanei]|uniref:Uncharacterized protein n=1 Tax=Caenorhabditis remanei TaxID=31234 RepID=A0A6A5HK81_CAERE|nr:hypothetical protein GCK72_000100 [Caenorhabditis remanei]KAF1768288.1 hypothetical protein GCK72_000100 [Caenorhabditis remanei]